MQRKVTKHSPIRTQANDEHLRGTKSCSCFEASGTRVKENCKVNAVTIETDEATPQTLY